MTKLLALVLAGAACGAPASASPATTPTPTPVPACDVAGAWELTVDGKGCPVPRNITLVDGVGHSLDVGTTPAMDWTLIAKKSSTGSCDVALRGSAGRLFTVEARGARTGAALTASGRSKPGATRYTCGGDVTVTGSRR